MEWSRIWSIEPIAFHPALLGFCEEAVREIAGAAHRLPSGPLHDAAEVARAGIPTVMMFVQSLRGISHNKIEDTKEEHLEMSVQALDRLATKDRALDWGQGYEPDQGVAAQRGRLPTGRRPSRATGSSAWMSEVSTVAPPQTRRPTGASRYAPMS